MTDRSTIIKRIHIAVLIIGMNGVLTNMLSVGEYGKISESGGLVLLISLALGAFIGEIIKLDDKINSLGKFVENKVKSGGFSKGFVSAFIIFCVGSMSIIGSVNDGLSGDSSVLMVKSTLDFITAAVLASAMGIGVIFATLVMTISGLEHKYNISEEYIIKEARKLGMVMKDELDGNNGLFGNGTSTFRTVRNPNTCIQQTEVIINLSYSTHGRTWITVGRFLINGNGWWETFDTLYIRLFHLS